MGFYVPSKNLGYASRIPPNPLIQNIFFYEMLTVASAVGWAAECPKVPRRLLLYTDSMNTVEMFYSMRAGEGYNGLLLFVVELLISKHISLRVCHMSGINNPVADTISRVFSM
ncbi:hypothetical protein M422DRAFT_155460 [Sphaerobolus stellatus SS14]|nr:hypothetical protein M422DRAFT_155460 [Sphaerobolus stellatus SS14]